MTATFAASRFALAALCGLLLGVPPAPAQESATSISFQGVLNGTGGVPLPDGLYTLGFQFWNHPTAAVASNRVGDAVTVSNVAVAGGVASTAIPVEAATFDGSTRYLGITVAGQNGGDELAPRVLVTAVPYAVVSQRLSGGGAGFSRPSDGQIVHQIGTSDEPAEDLVLYSSGGSTGMRFISAGGSSDGFSFHLNSATPNPFGGTRPPTPGLRIRTAVDQPQSTNRAFIGINTANPENDLHVNGSARITDDLVVHHNAFVGVLHIRGGSDLAEPFDVTRADASIDIQPGMVMVIDREQDGKLTPCSRGYDTAVAGIISGAKGLQPGMVMQAEGQPHAEGEHPVAMTGRVWCHADAAHGPICRGDRLTTSSTPGHAMRVGDAARAPGAVIGKALTELESGTGLVLVLVNLQ